MGLSGLHRLNVGWRLGAAATVASGDRLHDAREDTNGWPASARRTAERVVTEDLVHAEMHAAGHAFGLKVAQTPELASDIIRDRAAWWSEHLREEGINPRLAERFVTTFIAAAHAALRERP